MGKKRTGGCAFGGVHLVMALYDKPNGYALLGLLSTHMLTMVVDYGK